MGRAGLWGSTVPRFALCSLYQQEAQSKRELHGEHLQPPGTLGRCPTHQPLATESCTRVTAGLSSPKQTPRLQEGAGLAAGQGGCSQQPPLLQGKKREI